MISKSDIDPIRFERWADEFVQFVERKSGQPFESFASNPYTDDEEGYKQDVYRAGNAALGYGRWSDRDIGTGKIIRAAISAVEIPRNNLVQWQARYGEEKRPQQPLYDALEDVEARRLGDECLFALYRSSEPSAAFNGLLEVVGRKYPLIAYLFFLKDKARFLPVAPATLKESFLSLGVEFQIGGQCSWSNYQAYNSLILQIRDLLAERLQCEVTSLDAHSFAWMISRQMAKEGAEPDLREYDGLSDTEREAVIKARIGQGRFRQGLLAHWGTCAVTGIADPDLLRASHIIPWSEASVADRTNLFNGLLLAVHIDALFDAGYVSFRDNGEIIISSALSDADAEILGVDSSLQLRKVDHRHLGPLAYHRENRLRLTDGSGAERNDNGPA